MARKYIITDSVVLHALQGADSSALLAGPAKVSRLYTQFYVLHGIPDSVILQCSQERFSGRLWQEVVCRQWCQSLGHRLAVAPRRAWCGSMLPLLSGYVCWPECMQQASTRPPSCTQPYVWFTL
jgi:hypothetical protein